MIALWIVYCINPPNKPIGIKSSAFHPLICCVKQLILCDLRKIYVTPIVTPAKAQRIIVPRFKDFMNSCTHDSAVTDKEYFRVNIHISLSRDWVQEIFCLDVLASIIVTTEGALTIMTLS